MKELIRLSLPIVATYIGMMAMGFVDIVFVGRINSAAIGAVGLGTSVFLWFLVFGLGMLSGMEYLVARAHGAIDIKKRDEYLVQGIFLAIGVSIPLTIILYIISSHLEWFGINPEVLVEAKSYSTILSLSLPASILFSVCRLYLTAMGVAAPAMLMLILGNIINGLIDYVLVLGRWGFSSQGAVGSAWATLTARILMMFGMMFAVYCWRKKNENKVVPIQFKYKPKVINQLIALGTPAALQMVFEVGVFALVTTLSAQLTVDELATHQIVLNIASITFMVPFGVGSAAAVLVGQDLGKKRFSHAVQTGWLGFALGVGFMAFSGIGIYLLSDPILRFFTSDPEVIRIGQTLLLVAALFQLSDGTQAVGTGALRGLGDTKSPMIINLIGHWLIGLPVGVGLCFFMGYRLKGLWIGLSFGLGVVAVAILMTWMIRSKKLLSQKSV
jgi:MATE family multidrug resistance protein